MWYWRIALWISCDWTILWVWIACCCKTYIISLVYMSCVPQNCISTQHYIEIILHIFEFILRWRQHEKGGHIFSKFKILNLLCFLQMRHRLYYMTHIGLPWLIRRENNFDCPAACTDLFFYMSFHSFVHKNTLMGRMEWLSHRCMHDGY